MAANISSNFSIASYNLHGFNQGNSFLSSLCDSSKEFVDCVLIQEHWLTPDNMFKLENYSNEYRFYGISAMEEAVSHSVLRGRPFGGVGVLLKNKYCDVIKFLVMRERFPHFDFFRYYYP